MTPKKRKVPARSVIRRPRRTMREVRSYLGVSVRLLQDVERYFKKHGLPDPCQHETSLRGQISRWMSILGGAFGVVGESTRYLTDDELTAAVGDLAPKTDEQILEDATLPFERLRRDLDVKGLVVIGIHDHPGENHAFVVGYRAMRTMSAVQGLIQKGVLPDWQDLSDVEPQKVVN